MQTKHFLSICGLALLAAACTDKDVKPRPGANLVTSQTKLLEGDRLSAPTQHVGVAPGRTLETVRPTQDVVAPEQNNQ